MTEQHELISAALTANLSGLKKLLDDWWDRINRGDFPPFDSVHDLLLATTAAAALLAAAVREREKTRRRAAAQEN